MTSAGENWVAGYVEAWRSNDPERIGALFGENARYFSNPDSEPRVGRDAIVDGWLEDFDEPGTWTFRWRILREDAGWLLVQGYTAYPAERDYLNLWIVQLDDEGRAEEFTEWYMPRTHVPESSPPAP